MFLILALPRSRTFWISKFLSYREYECGHEEARYLRSIEDAKIWITQERRGSSETSISSFWRLIHKANPNLRIVTVRRPVSEVVKSVMAIDIKGDGEWNEEKLTKNMMALDAKLSQIERRLPNVLSVNFHDLDKESVVKNVFEHCLPYAFDKSWWLSLASQNLQCNMRSLVHYVFTYRQSLDRMVKTATQMSRSQMMVRPPKLYDGVTIQQEKFDDWERDGVPLFQAHCVEVGESPDNWKNKNIPLMRKLYDVGALQITTARCNGRMFGYLAAILNPSLESGSLLSGLHMTFYVSKDMPGLGLKLQRASVVALRQRGVGEVFFHEGIRGDGPRIGVLYKRMGAKEFGKFYRMEFKGA